MSSFADTWLCKISARGLCCETNTSTWRVSFAIWIHQANLLSGSATLTCYCVTCCRAAHDMLWVDERGRHEMLSLCAGQVLGRRDRSTWDVDILHEASLRGLLTRYVRDVHSLLANGSGEKTPHRAVGKKITSELDVWQVVQENARNHPRKIL